MPKHEKNTFGLPSGEPLRKALVRAFRAQRKDVLAQLAVGKKADEADPLPLEPPPLKLGALAMSERMTPILSTWWDKGGKKLLHSIDLDPNAWSVTNPHVKPQIEKAALNFCTETNKTTSLNLAAALAKTREELVAGVVTTGESVPRLTKRVNAVFDGAETWRARRIAQTEASRAVHAGQEAAAIDSGIVKGWEWLCSADCCPLCRYQQRKCQYIRLHQAFAVIGDNPTYSTIKFAPLHPHCNCTVLPVVDPAISGLPEPKWGETLIQPVPEEEDGATPKKPKPKPGETATPPGGAPVSITPASPVVPSPPATVVHNPTPELLPTPATTGPKLKIPSLRQSVKLAYDLGVLPTADELAYAALFQCPTTLNEAVATGLSLFKLPNSRDIVHTIMQHGIEAGLGLAKDQIPEGLRTKIEHVERLAKLVPYAVSTHSFVTAVVKARNMPAKEIVPIIPWSLLKGPEARPIAPPWYTRPLVLRTPSGAPDVVFHHPWEKPQPPEPVVVKPPKPSKHFIDDILNLIPDFPEVKKPTVSVTIPALSTIVAALPKLPVKPVAALTIAERIAAYADGDKKVDGLVKLGTDLLDAEEAMHRTNDQLAAALKDPKATKEQRDALRAAADLAADRRRSTAEHHRLGAQLVCAVPLEDQFKASDFDVTQQTYASSPKNGPRKQTAKEEGIAWVRSVLKRGNTPQLTVAWDEVAQKDLQRAWAYWEKDKSLGLVFLANLSKPITAVHELGHIIEHGIKGAEKAAIAFLEHRIKDQKPQKMAKLFPGVGYAVNEIACDDDFGRHFKGPSAFYVGKIMRDKKKKITATEIISKGVEALCEDPSGFARNDPEYCKFILGILDGTLR